MALLPGRHHPGTWTSRDTLLITALWEHERGLCSGCGHHLEESTAPDADPSNRSGRWRYDAGLPSRCFACTALESASDPYTSPESGTPVPGALRWVTRRVLRRTR